MTVLGAAAGSIVFVTSKLKGLRIEIEATVEVRIEHHRALMDAKLTATVGLLTEQFKRFDQDKLEILREISKTNDRLLASNDAANSYRASMLDRMGGVAQRGDLDRLRDDVREDIAGLRAQISQRSH